MSEPDPKLLRAALDDRDKRPWRYYKFDADELKRGLDARVDIIDAQAQEIATLTADLSRVQGENTALHADRSRLRGERDTLWQAVGKLRAQLTAEREKHDEEAYNDMAAALARVQGERDRHHAERNEAYRDHEATCRELVTIVVERDTLAAERDQLREALTELRDAVKQVPQMNAMKYDALGVKVNRALASLPSPHDQKET